MNIIFIDTNIYLRFFDGNRKELKKLLDDLLKISGNIFITNQIVSEIERNKLPVFKNSINNYTNKLNVEKVSLPEHFTTDLKQSEIQVWNESRETLRKNNDKLTKEINKIFIKNIEQISKSEDSVSKKLAILYKLAINESKEELDAARKRREIGNPPGKDSDPLGDQITWEQFLNSVSSYDEVWIVTNDFDYFTEYNKICFLNPFLYSELLKRKPNLKINCFNDLLTALASFGKKNIVDDFLDKKLVTEIRQEEKNYRIVTESTNINSVGYDSKKRILEIEFHNGSLYQYFDIPTDVYNGLLSSPSVGKYFITDIKGIYKYRRI